MVSIARELGIFIIEDDIYGDLHFGKHRPDTLKQWDEDGRVFYCSSFSKTLAPGFRIGYCIPGRFGADLLRQKRLLSLGTNTITQAALANFMETGRYDLHLKKLRKQLHLNLLQYGACVLKYFPEEAHFQVPEGGYVLWIGFPLYFDSYQLFHQAKKLKVVVVPGHIFSTGGTHRHYIRLSYAEPFCPRIETALKELGSLARQLCSGVTPTT